MGGRFLSIGECMVELSQAGDGLLRKGFAGDTFNTAWYARACLPEDWSVDYFTALGDDPLSEDMLAFIADAGIGNEGQHVFRKRIVAECGEIIDRPVFRQAGAGIPGGIERIARKTLAQQPVAGLRQFHHAFANRQKPSAHAVILPFFPAMRLTTSARR